METAKPVVSDAMKTIVSSLLNFNSLPENVESVSPQTTILDKIYKFLLDAEEVKQLQFEIEEKRNQLDGILENKRHKELLDAFGEKISANQDTTDRAQKEQNKIEQSIAEPQDSKTTKSLPEKKKRENNKSVNSMAAAPKKTTQIKTSRPKKSAESKPKTKKKPYTRPISTKKTFISGKKITSPRTTPKISSGIPTFSSSKFTSKIGITAGILGGAALTSTIPSSDNSYSEDDLSRMGFNIKVGATQRERAFISPTVIKAAGVVKDSVPGVVFTGFNDQFHTEKAPNSLHTKGLAVDFVLPKEIATNDDLRQQFAQKLAQQTGGYVIDEYARPSAHATGGHFHLQFTGQTGVDEGSGKFAGKGVDAVPEAVPAPPGNISDKISAAAKENKDLKQSIQTTAKLEGNTPQAPTQTAIVPPAARRGSEKVRYVPPAIIEKSQGMS